MSLCDKDPFSNPRCHYGKEIRKRMTYIQTVENALFKFSQDDVLGIVKCIGMVKQNRINFHSRKPLGTKIEINPST